MSCPHFGRDPVRVGTAPRPPRFGASRRATDSALTALFVPSPLPHAALAVLALAAGAGAQQNIAVTAQNTPSLSSLSDALASAGLVATLSGPGPFTVFAPVNTAFAKLPAGLVTMANSKLSPTLTLHVVSGPPIYAANITNVNPTPANPLNVVTVNGDLLNVTVEGGFVYLNGYAKVITADIVCSNGIVHLVDFVIMPNVVSLVDVAVAANLSTLVSVVTAAGLAPTLSAQNVKNAFTVLAPSNAAFAALNSANPNLFSWVTASKNVAALAAVLKYHVVAGGVFSRSLTNGQVIPTLNGLSVTASVGSSVTFSDVQNPPTVATVISADNAAFNGVAHVIDKVLLPTGLTYPTQDVVAVATGAGLSSLVDALSFANITSALQAPAGPFTVLAPNNAAFAKIPANTYNASQLATVLQYHVIPGRLYAADLKDGQVLKTLTGQTLTVSIAGAVVKFTGAGSSATVVTPDVDSSNAAVHVIDTVLVPFAPAPPRNGAASMAVGLAAAVAAATAVVLSL
jgi:transforming growth factor-beta-induced protein